MMKSANFGIYVVSCYYAVTFGKFPSSLATKIPIIKVEEVVTLSHFFCEFYCATEDLGLAPLS